MTTPTEAIYELLNIPGKPKHVIVLGMDAHMDWDWTQTFDELVYSGPHGAGKEGQEAVRTIITSAWELMEQNPPGADAPYMYSICEMGFLRAVVEIEPTLIDRFKDGNLALQLNIEGGGITSPDNLLTHSEGFIRCFMLGRNWVRETFGLSSQFAYLPDDFGHDSQLPIVLEAMGLVGVCFSRLPGSWGSNGWPLDGSDSLYSELMDETSADVFWTADDGSSTLAHVMPRPYYQGNGVSKESAVSDITGYYDTNEPASPSPYIYVPCGADFATPKADLVDVAATYNASPSNDAYCVVGTLEQYFTLVAAWSAQNSGQLKRRSMDPTPYWTGYYASRPELKILHQATVRTLLSAEVLGAMASILQAGASTSASDSLAWRPIESAVAQGIAQGWDGVGPSSHHDYVTGTSDDAVYSGEQVPLLRAAKATAVGALQTAVQSVATLIGTTFDRTSTPVLVLNSLGARQGLATIPSEPGQVFQSAIATTAADASSSVPVQRSAERDWLFATTAPALGYTTYRLSDSPPSDQAEKASIVTDSVGDTVTLTNSQMTVQLSRASGWSITSLQPIQNAQSVASIVQPGANALAMYKDLGNIYNFGNETRSDQFTLEAGTLESGALTVLEAGPVRVRVEADVTWTSDDKTSTADYTFGYELVAGEAQLGMTLTGSVPLPADPTAGGTPYSVMVRFPFASDGSPVRVDGVLRGTPSHWTAALPKKYWEGPTFQATHNFVVPMATETPLGAIYHSDIPAWAIDDEGAMIGCVLRNTPGAFPWPVPADDRGANGADFGVHTHHYSIRVPTGLTLPPSSPQALDEALAAATPFETAYINSPEVHVQGFSDVEVSFPETFSLASIVGGDALLTVAKLATSDSEQLILRLYQPSNSTSPTTVSLDLTGYISTTGISNPHVIAVTALEEPVDGAVPLVVTDGVVAVSMSRALITLQISKPPTS